MPDFLVSEALLTDGWARQVLLSVDPVGVLARVEPGTAEASGAEKIDGIALPGIPDLHSHAFQRALAGLAERRERGEEDTFWGWRERMYRFLSRLRPEEMEAIAAQLYVEMLKAGYTTVGEFHYLHNAPDGRPYDDPAEMSRRIVSAASTAGIGLALLPVVYTSSDFGGRPPLEGQRRFLLGPDGMASLLELLGSSFDGSDGGNAARRLGLALHSLRAVSPEELGRATELAAERGGGPVHIHVAEQRREVEACLAWAGARPVRWLLDHAPVDRRWCLVHATHMDAEEIVAAAATGAVAGLCPTTEANLGDGLFPLRPWLEAGGALGVGSDSHVSIDPAQELRWLEYGQRLASGSRAVAAGYPHASTGRSLLEAAVSGGARALDLPEGGLRVGGRADLLVLDAEHPALLGREGDALVDAWVFAASSSPVRDVMVGGRWVVRDGHHAVEEDVMERYRRVVVRRSEAL